MARCSSLEPRVWYNPELRSTLFLVPGLIAYIAMLTAVVSTSLSVVREKEVGTMEQVRMAPLGPAAVRRRQDGFRTLSISLISATGHRAGGDGALRPADARLVAGAARWRCRCFWWARSRSALLISTIAETQQVAFQLALLTSFLPTLMLSGFIFPISSMPAFLQVVTYVVPARYFLIALRGIVLKGVGPEMFWPELAALAVFASIILRLASLRLRRQWA